MHIRPLLFCVRLFSLPRLSVVHLNSLSILQSTRCSIQLVWWQYGPHILYYLVGPLLCPAIFIAVIRLYKISFFLFAKEKFNAFFCTTLEFSGCAHCKSCASIMAQLRNRLIVECVTISSLDTWNAISFQFIRKIIFNWKKMENNQQMDFDFFRNPNEWIIVIIGRLKLSTRQIWARQQSVFEQ